MIDAGEPSAVQTGVLALSALDIAFRIKTRVQTAPKNETSSP